MMKSFIVLLSTVVILSGSVSKTHAMALDEDFAAFNTRHPSFSEHVARVRADPTHCGTSLFSREKWPDDEKRDRANDRRLHIGAVRLFLIKKEQEVTRTMRLFRQVLGYKNFPTAEDNAETTEFSNYYHTFVTEIENVTKQNVALCDSLTSVLDSNFYWPVPRGDWGDRVFSPLCERVSSGLLAHSHEMLPALERAYTLSTQLPYSREDFRRMRREAPVPFLEQGGFELGVLNMAGAISLRPGVPNIRVDMAPYIEEILGRYPLDPANEPLRATPEFGVRIRAILEENFGV